MSVAVCGCGVAFPADFLVKGAFLVMANTNFRHCECSAAAEERVARVKFGQMAG